WGPRAIGDHGAPVSLPTLKKAYKRYQGISWGPLLTPGPRAHSSMNPGLLDDRWVVVTRGRLTTHGAPGNRGSWGPCVLAQTKKSL
ncbi:unnamed protein product, partial [Staurois parvus]